MRGMFDDYDEWTYDEFEGVDFYGKSDEEILIISAADLAKIIKNDPELNKPPVEKILYQLGMDIEKDFEVQENVTHRDAENNIVTTDRYVGFKRTDDNFKQLVRRLNGK